MKETTVVIIGGGATGSGVLRDLAMRGIPALLLEKGGICNGTSSRFHGLLHSGGRYAVSDTEAAAECIRENMILRRIGHGCVRDTEGFFVLTPQDDPDYVDKWVRGCAEAGIAAEELEPAEALSLEPGMAPDVKRVFRVPDASIDGFRLVLHNAMSARRYGGEILTYREVVGITQASGRVTGVDVGNRLDGTAEHIACQFVVNAAGSWSGRVAGLAGLDVPVTPDKGTLIVFNHRFSQRVINRLHKSSDGDIFVPHGSITILGTTSQSVKDPEDSIPSTRDVLRLMELGKPLFPQINAFRILRAFAGTRPLYTPGSAEGRSVSRGFHIADHAAEGLEGFVTVFGGKFTTYRLMAEQVCDIVAPKLGVTAPCRTAEEPIIPDPDPALLAKGARIFMPQGVGLVADRLGDEFGDCVGQGDCALAGRKDYNPLMCECEMISWREIQYVASRPSTHSLNDIRLRTRIGMGTCQGTFCALRIASALVEAGVPFAQNVLKDLRRFVQERWKGIRYVYWGQLAREIEMTRDIYCASLAMDEQEGCGTDELDFMQPRLEPDEKAPLPAPRFTSRSDCVVVGAGLAGMAAALAAARQGQRVTLVCAGAGSLSVSTCAVDVLGMTARGRVEGDPLQALGQLAPVHPYVRLGEARVLEACRFLRDLAASAGWTLAGFEGDRLVNTFVPTAAGTEKATCLVPASMDGRSAVHVRRVLVCDVEGIRDCTPALAMSGLSKQGAWSGAEFAAAWLKNPASGGYRTATALDCARALDGRGQALEAFCRELSAKARGFDAVLLPPVLGTRPGDALHRVVCEAAGCPVLEMAALPPGVTGMRLSRLFLEALRREGVCLCENTRVLASDRQGRRVTGLFTSHEDGVRRFEADRFVLATGGVLGGGITLEPGRGHAPVLGLSFPVPEETAEWTRKDVFAPQPFAMLGVPVTESLQPSLDGFEPFAENVRMAGRSIGGFDPVFEKSGNGTALATGFASAVLPWK